MLPKPEIINQGSRSRKLGYARVSTLGQDLTDQEMELKEQGCDVIYTDKLTGKNTNRPGFQQMMGEIKSGDTLIVTKLDRLARSAEDALTTARVLREKGIKVHILNIGMIDNSSTGKLLFTILAAFAEFERDLIVQRMLEGKEIAKQNPDYREGRPKKFTKKALDHAMSLRDTYTMKEISALTNIGERTLYRYQQKIRGSETLSPQASA